MGNYSVIERDVGGSTLELTNLERGGAPSCDIESFAIARRCEKDVIIGFVADSLGKARFETDGNNTSGELPRAEVFNPVLWGLHAVNSRGLVVWEKYFSPPRECVITVGISIKVGIRSSLR
jgi:hypothetical protein